MDFVLHFLFGNYQHGYYFLLLVVAICCGKIGQISCSKTGMSILDPNLSENKQWGKVAIWPHNVLLRGDRSDSQEFNLV